MPRHLHGLPECERGQDQEKTARHQGECEVPGFAAEPVGEGPQPTAEPERSGDGRDRDQRKPLYSVWKPATSSDSASGRSKGARLVSATMATAKMKKATRCSGKNLKRNQTCCCCCALTISIMLSVPVAAPAPTPYTPVPFRVVSRTAAITASPMAI